MFKRSLRKDHNDLFKELDLINRGNNSPIKGGKFSQYRRSFEDIEIDYNRYLFLQEIQKMGLIEEINTREPIFPPAYRLTTNGSLLHKTTTPIK